MKIIIPMAGRGSRLRPHTLTVPKPLVPIAGKPMVQRLVEGMAATLPQKVEEVAFVIGDFDPEVPDQLRRIAEGIGAKGFVYTQDEPLGTAHAILCAGERLSGPCVIAFSDTLFKANFDFDMDKEGIIWVQKVEDPSAFGVVKVNDEQVITDFVEKPTEFVSNLAIVGIYYVKDGARLRDEMQALIDQDIKDRGEYQLTNALENMKQKGFNFSPAQIEEWLDCGNKEAVVHTNQRILEFNKEVDLVSPSALVEQSVIIPPCYIGKDAEIRNAVIGPYVSVGNNSKVSQSVISNTVIQNESEVSGVFLKDAMIGNKATVRGHSADFSVGDYSNLSL